VKTKSEQYQKIKEYRARIWAHPEHYRCLCGNVGYKFKSGDIATPVCKRCDEIENNSHQLKDFHHTRGINMKWDEPLDRMIWRAGLPDWILDSLTQAETMLLRIESWIDDTSEVPICDDCGGSVMAHLDMCPITVHGHGTYVLQLEDKV
jgi:hypothetical protein